MKKIIISGEIGWEVTSRGIREQLKGIKATEDLEIDMSSPGGSVFQGVEIANLIRDHKGKTTLTISGAALSMGSYISEMADIVRVHDNSSFMMHNPWMFSMGDFQDFEKDAKFLKSLAGMTAIAYSSKSGKSKAAIQKLMNETTWLFGQEIVDAGFADEIIETESTEEKGDAVAFAKLQFQECMKNLKSFEGLEEDNKKIAALLQNEPAAGPGNGREIEPKGSDIKPKEEKIMDFNEWKAKYPEFCARLTEEGKEKGKDELQDQVNGHLGMAKNPAATAYALECLKDGKSMHSQEVIGEYMQLATNGKDIENREVDNPAADLSTDTDTELSEQAKEDSLYNKTMGLSDKQTEKGV